MSFVLECRSRPPRETSRGEASLLQQGGSKDQPGRCRGSRANPLMIRTWSHAETSHPSTRSPTLDDVYAAVLVAGGADRGPQPLAPRPSPLVVPVAGGADVGPRSQDGGAGGEAVRVRGLDDAMLLALAAEGGVEDVEQRDVRADRVGRDRLVAQVEAEPVRERAADDSRQQDGSGEHSSAAGSFSGERGPIESRFHAALSGRGPRTTARTSFRISGTAARRPRRTWRGCPSRCSGRGRGGRGPSGARAAARAGTSARGGSCPGRT